MSDKEISNIIKIVLLGFFAFCVLAISLHRPCKSSVNKIEMVHRPQAIMPDTVVDSKSELVISVPTTFKYSPEGDGFSVAKIKGVKITAYNNLPDQTNSQPNIGASNRKVFEGSIALSRDILATNSVRYGDLACVLKTNKCYIVEDTMNRRYDNRKKAESGWRADIFMYDKKEAVKVNFKSDLLIIKQL